MTPDWLESRWCFAEAALARSEGKPVFVVERKPSDRNRLFPDTQHIDATQDLEAAKRLLARSLREMGHRSRRFFRLGGDPPGLSRLGLPGRGRRCVFRARRRNAGRPRTARCPAKAWAAESPAPRRSIGQRQIVVGPRRSSAPTRQTGTLQRLASARCLRAGRRSVQ